MRHGFRLFSVVIFLTLFHMGQGHGVVNEDNRPLGAISARELLTQVDERQVIRFSGTVVAGVNQVVLPDLSVEENGIIAWPSGITFSTTPAKLNGGRMYAAFQAIASATNTPASLWWSLDEAVSTTTNPYLTNGQWWPPTEWPAVYQSTVTVRSTATYTISGFIITEKKR